MKHPNKIQLGKLFLLVIFLGFATFSANGQDTSPTTGQMFPKSQDGAVLEGTSQAGNGSFLDSLQTSQEGGTPATPESGIGETAPEGGETPSVSDDSGGKVVSKRKPKIMAKLDFQAIIGIIKKIIQAIFGGGWGGGGGGGGDDGGGTDGGDDGDVDGGEDNDDTDGDTGGGTTTTTPGTTPGPVGDVPSGVSALKSAIKSKFGTTMAGNWSEKSLKAVYKTLSVLPENFRKRCKYMERGGNRGGLLGMGTVGSPGQIWIYGGAFSGDGTGIGTIVHEMCHNFQGNSSVTNAWRQTIRGRSVSSYGNTNSLEDMCESVRTYYTNPSWMKKNHPSRYNFVKDKIMGGVEFQGNEWK